MLDQFVTVARALADPTRLRILKLLEPGPLCVCQITASLDLAPATVSKHLSALKLAGLVQARRDGKWVLYRLAEQEINPHARAFLTLLRGALDRDPAITADADNLARILSIDPAILCEQGRAAIPQTEPDSFR